MEQKKVDNNRVKTMGNPSGCEVKYREPCPSAIPGGTPAGDVSHIEMFKELLAQHEIFKQILQKLTGIVDSLSIAVSPKQEEQYYNTPQTAIQVATPNPAAGQILDPGQITNGVNPGYQQEMVYIQLGRMSPAISVINDGNSTLFVIATPDGINWSQEAPILVGEARRFFNVYELRLRSPAAGTITTSQGGIYRVTEYEYSLAYTSTVTFNRLAFDAQVVNAPLAGALLPNIPVPNGFALVIRSNVNNAAAEQIFIGNSVVNATTPGVPGNRDTLEPGGRVALYVTNANLVAVASTTGAGNVDILVEQ